MEWTSFRLKETILRAPNSSSSPMFLRRNTCRPFDGVHSVSMFLIMPGHLLTNSLPVDFINWSGVHNLSGEDERVGEELLAFGGQQHLRRRFLEKLHPELIITRV